ncbi:caspase-6 [Carassius auratus]|uniref:Caspase-6 n=1 Tax=Carassius auratus TaxID=7957 RepID=A0A6P6JPE5_CARAU|nr:caspase-6-like [Carassius auratus]XP_052403359.1 caspase-6-like [Carassius gibelio]
MASHVKSDESGTVEMDCALAGLTVRENITETDGFNQSLNPSEEYRMDHKKRGMALIFNHERFDWKIMMSNRSGTEADKHNLVRRFQDLGFEVKAYDNYKRDEVMSIVTEAAAANHVDADCFVCVFLSHGENGHIYAYDTKIEIQEITDLFKGDKCCSLVGKPKIFIFQACRGDKHDEPVIPMDAVDSHIVNEVVVDAGVLCTLPAGADFLMCYSVAEGYFSHREVVNGSWYIQDLCDILRHHGSTLEFTDILTLVNRKVSFRSVGNCRDRSAIGKKQVPCFASMLTKKLFFRPKKEQ